MSDCVIGIKGADFVILAADAHCAFSVVNLKVSKLAVVFEYCEAMETYSRI